MGAVAVGVSQYRPKHEEWADALIVNEAILLSENIRNCEIGDIDSHQDGTPFVVSTTVFQRSNIRSTSFGRAAVYTAIFQLSEPTEALRRPVRKERAKASSAGMSIDSDPSGTWRLSAHFHVSEHGSSRAASMMLVDE